MSSKLTETGRAKLEIGMKNVESRGIQLNLDREQEYGWRRDLFEPVTRLEALEISQRRIRRERLGVPAARLWAENWKSGRKWRRVSGATRSQPS